MRSIKPILGALAAVGMTVTATMVASAKPAPQATPGSLTINTATTPGPYYREHSIDFNATYGKTPQNKVPWVEVDCYDLNATIAFPGQAGGSVPLWVGRDYDAPYSVYVGDGAGGTSLWKNAGYPTVKCQAFLYLYYDVQGSETVALFGNTAVFQVSGATG